MFNPDAAGAVAGGGGGGGGGNLPQLNSAENGVWTYTRALQDWCTNTNKFGSNTNAAAACATPSSTHIVAQSGATKEFSQEPVHSVIGGGSSNSTSTSTSRSDFTAEVVQQQQQQQPLRKKANFRSRAGVTNRWENHKKETCKCAVCMTNRGELKSSWYNHNQLTCVCAVCRQSRGQSRPRGVGGVGGGVVVGGGRGGVGVVGGRVVVGGVDRGSLRGKHSTPAMLSTRASWVSGPEPSVECWDYSRELPRGGGGQLQKPSPFVPSQQPTSFPSGNNVLNSSLAPPPVRPEGCATTGIPIPWQQKLANIAKGRTDCSSAGGISPKNIDAEQRAFQTNLSSKSRWSGWPNAECAYPRNFTGGNLDGVQQWRNDCVNVRGHPAVESHNSSTGLSWQDTVNKRQDAAGSSTGLHNAESPLLERLKPQLPWESVKETSSAISAVTERDGHWSSYPTLGNMTKTEPDTVGVLPDRFLSLRQSTSFLGGHSSSMAHVQLDAASHSTMFTNMDFKPVYVPFQSSTSPPAHSGRSSSVVHFPFGLEVQADAEHDMYQPVSDLQAPIHTRSISFNFDEGTMESSSPPCETTSTTSIVNEKDICSPVMDIDSGDILRSSCAKPRGSLEKYMTCTDVDAGAQASDQQVQSGREKGDRSGKPVRQNFSKRLANPDENHFSVHPKRAKREGVSRAGPKWCQLIHSKYDYLTIIRKIYIRSRVPKRSPQSPLTKVLEPGVRKNEKNCNAGSPTLGAQGDNLEGRSRFEESIAISNLQSTSPTNVMEPSNWKDAPKAFIHARRDNIEEQRESVLNQDCTRESLNSKKYFETSSETKAEDSPREMKIRKLNSYGIMPERLGLQCAASAVQRSGNIHDESEAREVEMPSLSESPDYKKDTSMVDLSSITRKIKREEKCSIDDHSGTTVQVADPLIQNVLVNVSHGLRGTKRSTTGAEICSEGRQSRLDPLRHVIPQLEDKQMLQPLKKRWRDHGASMGTSALCTDVDTARTTNLSSKPLKLTIEVLLPESMKVYYLTKILRARTPELTVWSMDLLRCIAHQSPSLFVVHSHALVPKDHSSLCSPPRVCPPRLYMLRRALKKYLFWKTTGLVTWPKVRSGTRICCTRNIENGEGVSPSESQLGILQVATTETLSENINFGSRSRVDEELLRRVWHVLCAKHGFLLPHDRPTFYMEDLLRHKPVDRMIEGASGSLSTSRKYCFYSLLCDIGLNVDLGGTKVKQEKLTAFEQHQQPLTQEMKLIPLRNISYPYWIDKPLNGSIRLIFPIIILKRSLPRLLSSSAAHMCITSREQDRTAKSHCKHPTQYSAGKQMEDDFNAERRHREQIYSDGILPQGHTSPPANVVTTIFHNLMRHEQSPGSSAVHGTCSTSTKPRSLQTPSANSFQDLLKSVDNNASPPLSNNSESRTDPRGRLHPSSSSECPRSIPCLDVVERQSELRNNGPTSSALSSRSDSIPVLGRRRGCPKGGWPKKKFSSGAANKDSLDNENKYSLRSLCRNIAAMDPVSSTNETEADPESLTSETKKADPESLTNETKADPESLTNETKADPVSLTNETKAWCGIIEMAGAEVLSPEPPVDPDNTTSQLIADVEADIEVIHPAITRTSKSWDSEFKRKLTTFLARPFRLLELKDLERQAFLRKPLLRLRETRHRVLHVATKKVGMSYLDYHPDLARQVADAAAPEERLRLLRGFFFWLQHSCISGSFKPWAPDVDEVEEIDDDCVEIPKEWFATPGPEAAARVELGAYLHDQKNVGKTNTTDLTPRTRGRKRKSVSQPTKSKYIAKEMEPSMEAAVKRERGGK